MIQPLPHTKCKITHLLQGMAQDKNMAEVAIYFPSKDKNQVYY